MAESGLALDPFQRIVNVRWGGEGAVFVAGGGYEFVLYAKIKNKDELEDKEDIFTDLGPLDFTIQGGADSWPAANVSAASCRPGVGAQKPLFILGGNDAVRDGATGTFGSGSVVMVSHDGQNWTQAFRKQWPDYYGNDSVLGDMARDGDAFYGLVYSSEYYSAPPDSHTAVKSYYRLLVSGDGESWSEGGEDLRDDSNENYPEPPPPPSTEPPGLFMAHVNPMANLPDGKYAYYERKNSDGDIVESYLAVPSTFDEEWYLHGFVVVGEYGNSIDLTIMKDGETTNTTKSTPITHVTCAAYASEILMVGGASDSDRAQIAYSIDDGETWKVIYEGKDDGYQVINTITAAPLSDKPDET